MCKHYLSCSENGNIRFDVVEDVKVKLYLAAVRLNQIVGNAFVSNIRNRDHLYLYIYYCSLLEYHIMCMSFLNSLQKLRKNDVSFQSFD